MNTRTNKPTLADAIRAIHAALDAAAYTLDAHGLLTDTNNGYNARVCDLIQSARAALPRAEAVEEMLGLVEDVSAFPYHGHTCEGSMSCDACQQEARVVVALQKSLRRYRGVS